MKMFQSIYQWFSPILFLIGITGLGYFIQQHQFSLIFLYYTIAFIGYLGIIKYHPKKIKLILFGISSLILLFSLPNLSPDVYRFLWDGKLINIGIHPLDHVPNDLIQINKVQKNNFLVECYGKMTDLSKKNHTVYPFVNQLYFSVSSFFTDNVYHALIILRLLIVLTIFGGYYFLKSILLKLNLCPDKVFLYLLNPLIMIEFIGNFHFEGVMFTFLISAIYYLTKHKLFVSAIFLSLAINTKLTPLILAPLFIFYLSTNKERILYFVYSTLLIISQFLIIFWPSKIANLLKSLSLYYNNFEFNSPIYHLVYNTLIKVFNYEITKQTGWYLILVFTLTAFYIFQKQKQEIPKNLLKNAIVIYLLFVLLSSTIHPWYLGILIGLSSFYFTKTILLWSYTIVLSYAFYQEGWSFTFYILFCLQYLILLFPLKMDIEKIYRSSRI